MTVTRAGSVSIAMLPSDRWGPVHEHEQSDYVEGLCEVCGGWIAQGERHLTRAWLSGPAEVCQHLVCPAPTCPTCGGVYQDTPGTDDGYNVHTGEQRHKDAVWTAVGRSGLPPTPVA